MIIRVCLCIPTYNNSQTIESVVSDCLSTTEYPILVMDDGSDKPVRSLLVSDACIAAINSGRLRVIRFERNKGKGAALQAAFKDCVHNGFTHMFAVDGDGQHLASEVPKLIDVARKHPWDLIIGCRKFSSSTVPGSSKFGRKFSNYWVNFQTGTEIKDSQSGFRLYPLFHLQNMSFWTQRYDFEIEVLIRLIWKGVSIREAEIEVYYPPKDERISHFNKFWDNARLSVLNTALVIISSVKTRRSIRSSAFALGLGVWIGCTPFFGFHTLIVAAFATAFPLNALLLLLGSQISIPPLVPLLVLGSTSLGSLFLPERSFGVQYLAGSFVLGGLLCAITCLVVMSVAYYYGQKAKKRVAWHGKARGGKFGNWFLKQVTRYLGLQAAYACLFFIIPYFYVFAPTARRSLNEYWKILRPEMSFFRRQWQVMRHFFRYAQVLLDRLYQSFHKENQFTPNPNGMEHILGAVRAKDGVIMLSAHVGGWDLACALLQSNGLSEDFHLVKYQSRELNFDKVKGEETPDSLKSLLVSPASANQEAQMIFQIRELLEKGLPVGLMGDRPISYHYELVSFFGKLAPFDATPFRIAAACRKPVVFSFGFKSNDRVYDFYAQPARSYRYSAEQSRQLQCYAWVQEFATELEKLIRRYPTGWHNFYPFWSSLPSSPLTLDTSKQQNYLKEEVSKSAKPKLATEFAPTAIAES